MPHMNRGIVIGIGAYVVWGVLPVFWKMIDEVDPFETLAHRIVWSVVFLTAIVAFRRTRNQIQSLGAKTLVRLLLAGALLSVNWVTYIWAVNDGRIVEASLGYFINPLFNVALGVLILRERLEPGQWLAIAVATAGVVYMTVSVGSLPWVALVLATTFSIYALLKKQLGSIGPIESLTVEVALVALPAFAFLTFLGLTDGGSFVTGGPRVSVLLVLTGVATAVPLGLFGAAAKRIKLSTIGILQYIAPTLQFILGAVVYNELVERDELIGFVLVWIALAIFTADGLLRHRRTQPSPATI